MFDIYPRDHYLQIRNSSMVYYSIADRDSLAPTRRSNGFCSTDTTLVQYDEDGEVIERTEIETYSGTVTKGSKKRISRAVDIMLQITPTIKLYNPIISKEVDFKLSFITLTLSDNSRFISAKECYSSCLKPFLDWLRRTLKCNTYIWKAERQKSTDKNGNKKMSNGQLHYHITTNVFINHDNLRKKWNSLQKEAGYLEQYANQYKNYNPNSTDIHSVYNIENLEGYLIKYISKEPEQLEGESETEYKKRITVDGKIWDCSSNLRGTKFFKIEYSDREHHLLNKGSNISHLRKLDIEHCTFYACNSGTPSDYLSPNSWLDYCLYKSNLYYEQESDCEQEHSTSQKSSNFERRLRELSEIRRECKC